MTLHVTFYVKRLRRWMVRLWIARQLIALAAWIAWMDVCFEGIEEKV